MKVNYIFQNNKILFSIFIFIIFFIIIIYLKPNFLYTKKGTFRQFGLGKKNSTIIPIWLFILILAIFSYLISSFFIQN